MRPAQSFLILLTTVGFIGCGLNSQTVRPVQAIELTKPLTWPSFVPADEVALLNEAEKQIAEIRQGDLIVSVKNAWGQPADKVQVSWTQVDRDFRFGVDTPFESTVWADLVRIGVNHSVAELDWRNTQPRIGDIRLDKHVKAWGLNVFPGQRNSASAAGMVWLKKERMPDWVNALTPTEKAGAIDWHVTRLAEELRGRVSVWEVLREPTALHAGALENNGDLLKMARSATSAIRESDPVSSIMVSFKNPLGEHQEITPLAFSKRIKDADLEFDIIGLQYLYNGVDRRSARLQPKRSLAMISQSFEDFSLLGKDIHVTGISVPSHSPAKGDLVSGYWGKNWSPELQATYLKAFYTLAFAKKSVRAIVWDGGTDVDAESISGGLMHRPGAPKSSYHALRELLKRWSSGGNASVNKKGQLRFRGFAGDYHIVVTDLETNRQVVARAEIGEQQLGKLTIKLPAELTHSEAPKAAGAAQ